MTALEEEPLPREHQLAETPLAEQPTRLLGNAAIEGIPRDLCDSVLHMAIEADVRTPAEFTTLLHGVLSTTVQRVNERHQRPANTSVINPKHVRAALDDYYTVFTDANTPQPTPPTDKVRRHHLTTHAQYAQSHMYSYPEVSLLIRLESDLRSRAGEQTANAAIDLLAAYGWALRGGEGYAAARIDLYRTAGKTHLLANKRKSPQ